jgi:phosphate transport system permease protein
VKRRRARDFAFWAGCALAFAFIAAPSLAILIGVFHQAWPALGLSTITKNANANGLLNDILGTLILLFGVAVVAGTIGILGGIYLAEMASGRSGKLLRFFSEVLAGMPSIVIGYIGYVTLVVELHWGYSLLAGVFALSVLILPYIVRTTELAFRQVPSTLREAAAGLGLPRTVTIRKILLPVSLSGVISGLIVALAISTGELAPLLFTAGPQAGVRATFSLFHHPVPYLTNVVFTDISLPGSQAKATAAAAGACSLVILVVLIVAGRLVSARSRRATERMAL